jgi:hypothetical protein
MPLAAVLSGAFLNALIGFLILWLACRVYNWVAKTFGGIELELQEMPLEEPSRKTSEKISFLEKHQD